MCDKYYRWYDDYRGNSNSNDENDDDDFDNNNDGAANDDFDINGNDDAYNGSGFRVVDVVVVEFSIRRRADGFAGARSRRRLQQQ